DMENYTCPKCNGHLKINGKIIFSTKTIDNKRGLILMDPQMGVYDYLHHPNFEFIKGELVDFFCPICHANLMFKEKHENLAMVLAEYTPDNFVEVIFSRKAGEHCTFLIKGNQIESYGKDSGLYFDTLSFLK
ncbi:MAG: hypothetical protein JXR58_11680, partial [Bacteroidales bacterium]|nr:hypothetical protein [Bacteroidales bacterium]